jgi:glycosyltransferase involved in cell wall biosynthesis
MKRTLHLYNLFGARTERAWLDLPLELARRGHPTECACETISPDAPAVDLPLTVLRRVGVEPASDIDAQMDRIAEHVADPALRSLLDRGFEQVQGHFGPRVLHAAPFLARGVPTAISCYGYDVTRLTRDPAWPARYRWACRRGAVFVAISQAMKQRMIAMGLREDRLRVIPLGIDPDAWPFVPTPADRPARFLFVGRLTAKKCPLDLLAAAERLPEARLEIVGDGPLAPEARSTIERSALAGRVQLLGARGAGEIRALMRGATALVLPSAVAPDGDAEGTPVVLMEAQAAGLPVITTRHEGCPETLPPEAHRFLVDEHDVGGLTAAMESMMRLGEAERTGLQRAARNWIESHFNARRAADAYESLYRQG